MLAQREPELVQRLLFAGNYFSENMFQGISCNFSWLGKKIQKKSPNLNYFVFYFLTLSPALTEKADTNSLISAP